jgi:predicted PurR-regulated permease PerM
MARSPNCFIGITTIEGHLLTPRLTGRRLTMRPFVIFLSLGFPTLL